MGVQQLRTRSLSLTEDELYCLINARPWCTWLLNGIGIIYVPPKKPPMINSECDYTLCAMHHILTSKMD